MANDKFAGAGAERKAISLQEEYEVRYWCTKLKCTATELRVAVKAVGPSIDKVKAYLAGELNGEYGAD